VELARTSLIRGGQQFLLEDGERVGGDVGRGGAIGEVQGH
jgi:hypothetical protein